MNVDRLGLSWFGEEHKVYVLKKKNMKIINGYSQKLMSFFFLIYIYIYIYLF